MALTFDDTQAASLLELLGLPADTTDIDTILATVKDAVASEPMDSKPSAVAAAAKRAGLEVIDNDTLTALRAEAIEGRQIKAAAARQKIEDTVTTAISKGKITLSRRKHWVDLITADPGMADVLASVPDETAVPLTEIGHGVDSEGGPGEKREAWFY
ncbi:Mu-like prophage I protein [uncultured Mycobacterium sp.]|uniref:Mu-like prophage I protein n=1 Tax=uncultured Mycobacterium sp. TaxID=171292 RepID=A0A1Y5PTN8_9MYCO|nr:Mu-like prophage I protein [uncultured Mycobacterium sp.]